jgi:mannose-6-phosphate isomerase-like protein (cupin superfamily)
MDKLPVDRAKCERLLMGSDEVTILADCADSGGALFAVEILMRPDGGPPVMHRHVPGEVYHVLAGEFTFYTADGPGGAVRRSTAATGDVVMLAGGVPHTIRNESDGDAVAFVVHAPGAPMEQFARAAAAAATRHGPPDMARVLQIAADSGIELLGPIPEVVC